MKTKTFKHAKWNCPNCWTMTAEDRKHDRDLGCTNCPECGGTL